MSPRDLQRMSALQNANAIRSAQKDVRADIRRLSYRDGCEHVASLLESRDDAAAESLTIGRLLSPIRSMGAVKLRRVLVFANITSETRRVKDLSGRQRSAVAAILRNGCQPIRSTRCCARCAEPLPKSRVVWCSDECCAYAKRLRDRQRESA